MVHICAVCPEFIPMPNLRLDRGVLALRFLDSRRNVGVCEGVQVGDDVGGLALSSALTGRRRRLLRCAFRATFVSHCFLFVARSRITSHCAFVASLRTLLGDDPLKIIVILQFINKK